MKKRVINVFIALATYFGSFLIKSFLVEVDLIESDTMIGPYLIFIVAVPALIFYILELYYRDRRSVFSVRFANTAYKRKKMLIMFLFVNSLCMMFAVILEGYYVLFVSIAMLFGIYALLYVKSVDGIADNIVYIGSCKFEVEDIVEYHYGGSFIELSYPKKFVFVSCIEEVSCKCTLDEFYLFQEQIKNKK